MSSRLLLLGGGGHCVSVIDSIKAQGQFKDIGIVERNIKDYRSVLGVPLVGSDEELCKLYEEGYHNAFVTLGSVGNVAPRMKLYQLLKSIGFSIPIITDPTAIVSSWAKIEEGTYIGKGSIVNAAARIGKCAIINTGAIIEHECIVGDYAHVASGAVLGGRVHVGDCSHIGSNATIRQGIIVGEKSLIGSGSVVVKNISNETLAYGSPCKEVKQE